jgi:integrase
VTACGTTSVPTLASPESADQSAGCAYHSDHLSHMWQAMLAKAGVDPAPLHSARHTCATAMHLDGVPLSTIAAWLGHSSAAFTLRTYAKSNPNSLQGAANMIDSLAGEA